MDKEYRILISKSEIVDINNKQIFSKGVNTK